MRIDCAAWSVPALFGLIRSQGNIADRPMYRTFNTGIGMLVVLPRDQLERALNQVGGSRRAVGSIVPRSDDPVELT
jgi:phosphoribosylaminoimidazole (AIR) synthetase